MEEIKLLFRDKTLIEKIQKKLPELFQIAEIESSRAGKIGMEVGTIRERIIVALLLHVFNSDNVNTNIPTTEAEVDVRLFNYPISIKTFTGKSWCSVKLIWTVDPSMALEFQRTYNPSCGMILVQINWNGRGNLYYFTLESQINILNAMGRDHYIKLPKQGTNPRGVEISAEALELLSQQRDTLNMNIPWIRKEIKVNTFERWVDLWATA